MNETVEEILDDALAYVDESRADIVRDELSRMRYAEQLLREARKALPRMGEDDVIPGGGLPFQADLGERIDTFLGDNDDR